MSSVSNSKSLEDQNYQIRSSQGNIHTVKHSDLLGKNKQIIRLRDTFTLRVTSILDGKEELTLFNQFNPINTQLVSDYNKDYEGNCGAMVASIIDRNDFGPILDGTNLREVEVLEMSNKAFSDISNQDLLSSLAFNKKPEIESPPSLDLLYIWLTKEFYNDRLSIEDIKKYKKLFFRKIKSK